MKLENGKTYLNRTGTKVAVRRKQGSVNCTYKFYSDQTGYSYDASGRLYQRRTSPNDLVSEFVEKPWSVTHSLPEDWRNSSKRLAKKSVATKLKIFFIGE